MPTELTIGVAQLCLEPTLAKNRSKIARFLHEAKTRGCRVVVFPETALAWPPETTVGQIDAAVSEIRKVVDACDLYALIGGPYKLGENNKPFERLLVVDPNGRIIQTYHKLWHDARFNDAPGLFEIDGISCAATLCADRWIRSVEELPAMAGAKILFECSNNYDNEWIDDLGWYWYVPRALRNEVFVIFANTARENRAAPRAGHGHSAVIGPDGSLLATAGEESDKLTVTRLDLSQANGGQAQARRNHPLLKPFWDIGLAILAGQQVETVPHQPLNSPQVKLKMAAAQMACSRRLDDNLARIEELVLTAKENAADVVVFPEVAVTGARDEDIAAATAEDLQRALERLQQAAGRSQIYVVCGMPWSDGKQRYNCAVAIDPQGRLLTRYRQLAVDRPELFSPGTSTQSMWLEIKGVPCVLSVGRDALWTELAELAALRGAQVHLHLEYGRDTTRVADLRRKQLWVNLASFRTFTVTVNAASPGKLPQPSSPASGGSAVWDDFHRASSGKAGGYFPHSAVRLAEAKAEETVLYASQSVSKTNPQYRILTEKSNLQMTPWYAAGARAIFTSSDSVDRQSTAPFRNGKFHGRIAYSCDGNHNDPDDWAASPVALAIIAQCGAKDRLVHFDYNCILPQTDPAWEKTHAASVLGAVQRYGFDKSLFHDCRQDQGGAVASIAKAIDESSADSPLYFIVAGPMEVPYLGIQKSQPDKRKFVYCISHSRWNDGFASKYKFTHTKRSVIESGVHWVQVQDQNRLLSTSPYGRAATEDQWRPWHWMRDSQDERVRFLWERMQVSTRPDPSDAGMAWFLMTGDEEADPEKFRRLLDGKQSQKPMGARMGVRLEAENFRHLEGFELEDRNDKLASHRLSVKLAGREAGRIATRFDEPYTPREGRFDVQVRYFDDPRQRCRLALLINGIPQGAAWESPGKAVGWATHTVSGVEIRVGDEIAVQAQSGSARLDYVELHN